MFNFLIVISYSLLVILLGYALVINQRKNNVCNVSHLTYKINKNGDKKVNIKKRSPADFQPHEWEIICQRVSYNNKKIELISRL